MLLLLRVFRACGGGRGLTKSIVLDGCEFHGLYRTEVLWGMVHKKLCKSGENNSLIEEKMPVDIWSSQLIHDEVSTIQSERGVKGIFVNH